MASNDEIRQLLECSQAQLQLLQELVANTVRKPVTESEVRKYHGKSGATHDKNKSLEATDEKIEGDEATSAQHEAPKDPQDKSKELESTNNEHDGPSATANEHKELEAMNNGNQDPEATKAEIEDLGLSNEEDQRQDKENQFHESITSTMTDKTITEEEFLNYLFDIGREQWEMEAMVERLPREHRLAEIIIRPFVLQRNYRGGIWDIRLFPVCPAPYDSNHTRTRGNTRVIIENMVRVHHPVDLHALTISQRSITKSGRKMFAIFLTVSLLVVQCELKTKYAVDAKGGLKLLKDESI